ncbi:FAD-dependent monooxygenase [Nocardia aurantia]|uniref:Anhydrotetracycline monooxygenase n=1 Tax=Nocardia aurantia TaxID=2585199 RepID=A0A7K0DXE9_9NOCA|nr:FAD-dependent monooxygenase [Nocardia aurantia]MQY30460.1 Anhydrotetracycline monooxygenase [Nocardia aurantia]
MNESHDVVVAGAGPVGLMLACELALAGVDVLVVERLPEPDPTLKAGSITVPTAQALYRRGLLPRLRERQQAVLDRIAAFAAAAGPGSGAPAGPPPRRPVGAHFAGLMLFADDVDDTDPAFAGLGPAADIRLIDQQGIEALLADRAGELGVEVRRGVEIDGFTEDAGGVVVECGEQRVRASWLVGCDGGRSTVRKLAGFEFPGLDPEITGRQAVVEMTGAEEVPRGWHATDTGIYVYGPTPGRILTVELDGPPADRTEPVTAAELAGSFQRVTGVPVTITKVLSATRFTDNTRQVPEYRKGRILLAGDAAHVHSPFGGQGLNLGIGDAVNLGWKLAAVVHGTAGTDLLDTYTRERHPIGAWVLDWTRAQVALMRTDTRSRALRAVVAELLATIDGATAVSARIAGVLHRYDLGDTHPLVGAVAPDAELADGSHLGEHFTDGNAVLFDPAGDPALGAAVATRPRVRLVTTKPIESHDLPSMLVRPDGVVAWAGNDPAGLRAALDRWFGAA